MVLINWDCSVLEEGFSCIYWSWNVELGRDKGCGGVRVAEVVVAVVGVEVDGRDSTCPPLR